jgi:hypothetical protein
MFSLKNVLFEISLFVLIGVEGDVQQSVGATTLQKRQFYRSGWDVRQTINLNDKCKQNYDLLDNDEKRTVQAAEDLLFLG